MRLVQAPLETFRLKLLSNGRRAVGGAIALNDNAIRPARLCGHGLQRCLQKPFPVVHRNHCHQPAHALPKIRRNTSATRATCACSRHSAEGRLIPQGLRR